MPPNHLILCCPLLLPPSSFPSIGVFSNESVLRIRWTKYWSFSFSTSPSDEYSVLVSFRMDWLDLLAAQGLWRVYSNTTPTPQFQSTITKHNFIISFNLGQSVCLEFDVVEDCWLVVFHKYPRVCVCLLISVCSKLAGHFLERTLQRCYCVPFTIITGGSDVQDDLALLWLILVSWLGLCQYPWQAHTSFPVKWWVNGGWRGARFGDSEDLVTPTL